MESTSTMLVPASLIQIDHFGEAGTPTFSLLNDDLSFYGKAKIVVCLPNELFNDDNFGDTHVRIFFFIGWGPTDGIILVASSTNEIGRKPIPLRDYYLML